MPKVLPRKIKFCGDIITIRRNILGLSVAQIAKSVGVSIPSVHYWETGKIIPQSKRIPSLAKILKMKPQHLFLNVPKSQQ